MKSNRIAFLILSSVLLLLPTARAVTLPFYDGFAYSNGLSLGMTGSGSETVWTVGNSPDTNSPLVTSMATLSYSELPTNTGFGVQIRNSGTNNKERGVDTVSYAMTGAGETLYASFLFNIQSYPASNCPVAYFDDNGSPSDSIQGVGLLPDGRLTLHRNAQVSAPGGTTTIALSTGTTYLIVFRYKSVSGSGNDELALWVNPELGQPSETTNDLTIASGGSDRTALRGFFLKQNRAVSAVMYVDELRVGTTWADVTPSGLPVAPTITSQPTNQSVHAGETGTFTVTATGTKPLFYQWYFNTNSVLNLATNSTLVITNAQISDAGVYSVLVSNSVGSVTSSYATLSVNTNALPPTFTLQPASQIVLIGDTATFTAAATGTQPIAYQWKRNSVDIAGAAGTSLIWTNAQPTDAGTFTVVASNAAGSVPSDPATLTVTNIVPGDLYVSPTGTDANPGTPSQPTTLTNAIAHIPAGSTIWMRGGTYTFSVQITIGSTNSGGNGPFRKKIFAYPGEKPVLDFSSQPYTSGTNPRGIKINGHNWYMKGLEVYRSADSGIYISGKSNIVELCVAHHNRDTGIQLGRQGSTTPQEDWPSDTLILNCDSYDNYDEPPGSGENADGFACKLTTGSNNVFRGCISHNNIDDGWDLFTTDYLIGPVILDQCISYNNGTLTSGTSSSNGDRNGFKLGGSNIAVDHTVTRSIAFGNGKNGFTYNSNPGVIRMINNLAWNNVQGNYKFDVAGPIFYNNVSLWTSGSGVNDRYGGASCIPTGTNNIFWCNGAPKNDASLTVSAASFQSLTVPPGGFTRNADGSPNLGNFAKLVNGSSLINAGTLPPTNTVTLPYNPATAYEGAPDLGAIETITAAAPTITTNPLSQTVLIGSNVTITVAASGTAPLAYRWRKNSVDIAGATTATFTILNAQPSDAGQYSAVASNVAGTATSSSATLNVYSAFQFWQFQYFGCTNCPQSDTNADADGDGLSNDAEFQSGSNPTNSASALRIISVLPQDNDIVIRWNTIGGKTNAVQAGVLTNFVDISNPIIVTGTGETTTNFTHTGGATNVTTRFYRVRLVP